MSDMATESGAHARSKPRSRADIWFVLVLTGGTSAFLQMFHATHSGSTAGAVDVLVGLVPAATAIGLSHVVVSHKAATWLRVITVLVMLAFMAAAASASAAVVRPVEVFDFNWVFSIALDAAELGCVWVLLGNHERKAAEATALEVAEKAAADARREAGEAARKAAALETELATVLAALEAERARVVRPPKGRRGSGAKRAASSRPNKAPVSTPNSLAGSPPEEVGVATEFEAVDILKKEPGISGSELGRRLNVTERYGQILKNKYGPVAAAQTGEQPRVS
jgi:hypothetical protein